MKILSHWIPKKLIVLLYFKAQLDVIKCHFSPIVAKQLCGKPGRTIPDLWELF